MLAKLDPAAFERILIEWGIQRTGQVTGDHPAATTNNIDNQIAIDGKAQRGSTPHVADEQKARLVSAQSQPSSRVLGTVAVEYRSNEILAARALLEKLGPLDGNLFMLDALHPCQQTLRQAHKDNGADFLVPVKDNLPKLEARTTACLPDRTPAVIPPSGGHPALDLPPAARGTNGVPSGGWRPMPKRSAALMSGRWWKSPAKPSRLAAITKGRPASSVSFTFAASGRILPVAANCWNASAATGTSRAACTSGST